MTRTRSTVFALVFSLLLASFSAVGCASAATAGPNVPGGIVQPVLGTSVHPQAPAPQVRLEAQAKARRALHIIEKAGNVAVSLRRVVIALKLPAAQAEAFERGFKATQRAADLAIAGLVAATTNERVLQLVDGLVAAVASWRQTLQGQPADVAGAMFETLLALLDGARV